MENLWVIYHDYGGRSCAKTVPKEKFAAVAERGVVFARANLSMRFDDHQPAGATFLADTGDFLAVPDPATFARVPWQPATARVHALDARRRPVAVGRLSPHPARTHPGCLRRTGLARARGLRARVRSVPQGRDRRVRARGPRRHVHGAGARPALRAVARGHRRPARDGHRRGTAPARSTVPPSTRGPRPTRRRCARSTTT